MEINPLHNIRVVLVGTLYSGNVGSVCRAMANMGLRELVLVAPRLCDDWGEAARLAVHATDILDAVRRTETLEEAVADCCAVAGTTARGGLYRLHVRAPRELAPELLTLAGQGKVALVFGREDKGLSNEEIACCTHLVRIPVDLGYASLNLAQAVLICAYELYGATGSYEPPQEKSVPATAAEKIKVMEMWRGVMLKIGFMDADKADHMMQGFQRIFSRGVRTSADARILMGVARQTDWASGARTGNKSPDAE